jgi:hypothetical protein
VQAVQRLGAIGPLRRQFGAKLGQEGVGVLRSGRGKILEEPVNPRPVIEPLGQQMRGAGSSRLGPRDLSTCIVVRALEDGALVREAMSDTGGRRRYLRLERPRALLDAWLPLWQRRRIRYLQWDIGARNADEALSLLSKAVEDVPCGWALGGLAGAAMVRRVVEPADVVVWTSADDLPTLAHILQPEPARGGLGMVRVAVAPDPWTLGLARQIDGLPVADPVQLWLDASSEGERALEAADALAEAAGWS